MLHPTLHSARSLFRLLAVLLVLIAAAGCGKPKADKQADATVKYWESLAAIAKQAKALNKVTENAKTPEQIAAMFRNAAATITKMCDEITALPVVDVDPEATQYAAESVELYRQIASTCRDFASFAEESKDFQKRNNSVATGLEAFVRGFLGDPLGTYKDTRAELKQLEQRRLALLTRWQALQDKYNAHEAQGIRVRSSLATKYKRDFKKLDAE